MTNQIQAIDCSAPIGSLAAYEAYTAQIPRLSAAQEHAFALAWYENQDLQAAKQLVLAHLRFVVKIARNYIGYGLSQADLIQEGNIGLMKAVKRFDPHLGVRLAPFAAHWIKAEIYEFVLRNWRLIHVATTKAQRKLFFNLRRMKKNFHALTYNEAQAIAEELGVSTKTVQEMELRLYAQDVFLDSARDEESDPYLALPAPSEAGVFYQDPAQIFIERQTQQLRHEKLQQALDQLSTRTREIILSRCLAEKKIPLETLATHYGISAERVRQLEQAGILQLKKILRNML